MPQAPHVPEMDERKEAQGFAGLGLDVAPPAIDKIRGMIKALLVARRQRRRYSASLHSAQAARIPKTIRT